MTDAPFDPYAGGEMREPTEEELQAAYEAEMKRLRVEDVVVQTTVSLMNLGARRAGLTADSEDERDLGQVQMAIEAARALLPLVEPQLGPNAAPLREALSQLQMVYAQMVSEGVAASGEPSAEAPQAPAPGAATGSPPAQQPSRLWVPGQ